MPSSAALGEISFYTNLFSISSTSYNFAFIASKLASGVGIEDNYEVKDVT